MMVINSHCLSFVESNVRQMTLAKNIKGLVSRLALTFQSIYSLLTQIYLIPLPFL